ncbi:MAG: DUF2783 domain-containing protein [Alphaproteobacteria bacterium]|nr:DUF2783 domain-containing protein [Alphaproteobacteria bacterium]
MAKLKTGPGAADPDTLYEMLVDAHRDLDDAASAKVNAKLVLLLANHIDDLDVVRAAIAAARAGGRAG